MGIRDYSIPESFITALKKGVKGFKILSSKNQALLAYYIWESNSRKYRHKKHQGYMSIGYLELDKGFGRGQFTSINDNLNIFIVTNWRWSTDGIEVDSKTKATKGYKLTEHVQKVKDDYLALTKPKLSRLITLDGKVMHTLPDAIASKNREGVTATAWKDAKNMLPNSIPVDLGKMCALYEHLKKIPQNQTGDLFHDAEDFDIVYRMEILRQLIRLAHTSVAGKAFIAQRYIESRAGRLYATGISLQTAPRTIRSVALHGLYDYDIENCHYAIFSQLTARYGFECEAINYYLTNKHMLRDALASSVGITLNQVKMCLLAIMYGATRNIWHDNAIPEEIGKTKAEALYKNSSL